MPTLNPRLTITLKPESAAQLRALSKLTKQSQGSMVAEIIEQASPVFGRLIEVLQAAEAAKAEIRQNAVADLEEGQAQLEKQFGLAMDTFNGATQGVLDISQHVKRRAARGSGTRSGTVPRVESPPISNRGVRSTNNKTKGRKNGQI